MKIRSITCFIDPGWPLKADAVAKLGAEAQRAKSGFQQAGYEVQTIRMAIPPFPRLFERLDGDEMIDAVIELERVAADQGFAYLSIGPADFDHPESYALIPRIIDNTETVFCCAELARKGKGVSLSAVRDCAQIITDLAPQDPNGFANLYFTALANVEPGSPFFPAAYHDGGAPVFSLATEAAGLAVEAFEEAGSVSEGLKTFQQSVQSHADRLGSIAETLQSDSDFKFSGIDFSLAPFPEHTSSLGFAVEKMGIEKIGMHGSLAAAAMLASALDQVAFPRVGFSGLLFAQLEDAALAERASEGVLLVKDLLMYSAVCGTGLDTIPLPGETTPEQLVPLLLDLGALALRLDKPLTARLMPVPGKKAGDETSFDFAFFANSRVMSLSSEPLNPPVAPPQMIPVFSKPRTPNAG